MRAWDRTEDPLFSRNGQNQFDDRTSLRTARDHWCELTAVENAYFVETRFRICRRPQPGTKTNDSVTAPVVAER